MNNPRQNSILLILVLLPLVNYLTTPSALGQVKNVLVDQETVQTASVTNPKLIKFFMEDFMIPEEKVEKMVIYDLSGDGFGERDIARTFPGGRTYTLAPSDRAQKIMNQWSFGGNIKFTANFNDSPEMFEDAPDSVRAMGGIFASLLHGLRRNYKGIPIKMQLEQNNNVATVEMWGFDPKQMKYEAPPVAKIPERIPVMKLIYLEKTVSDTLYTGQN